MTKFENLIKEYEQYLTENGFPPIAPITSPGTPQNGNTSTVTTSAIDQAVDTDPNVVAARKKTADAIALQLKQKAGTITNP